MIKYAEKSDTEELKRLFNVCFPGEESFCSWIFENIYKPENTLIDVKDGVLRGSAMELPYKIKGIGDVTYLYAVGTFPEFRGKGICGNIINYSRENDSRKGRAASVLIPGNKSLFEFYRRLGYRESSFVSERRFTAEDIDSSGFCTGNCRPSDLIKVYEKKPFRKKYIIRNEEYFERQLNMFGKFGGNCQGLYDESGLISYCFYSVENGKILFDEIMGDKKEILASRILKETGFKEGIGREPGLGRPIGMAYFYEKNYDFYMNLMFN
ncbi:MAG: GNAT family N-acetyltransferase [Clostridiales bacterium]|nr:GNAT family N-acetyltransferase [Clostridiales bacterium]